MNREQPTPHVVITGVTRGLGRALFDGFSRQGCRVSGCGRSAEAVAQMQQAEPQQYLEVVDVGDAARVQRWADAVISHQGAPELLINNASLIHHPAPLWELSATEFAQLMQVNVLGVVHTLQAFVPVMRRRGRGVIVNISSSWGRQAEGGLSAYCASKFAVDGLTQSLAQELAQQQDPESHSRPAVVALDPGGGINTDMLQASLGKAADAYPSAEQWAQRAIPYLLQLGPADNGRMLTLGRD